MDKHIKKYFSNSHSSISGESNFYDVIPLHESESQKWEDLSQLCPLLPRGWFELAHLKSQDRIEFCRDFWISKLPFHVGIPEYLSLFFQRLDDIAVFLTQAQKDESWNVHMVYSLDDDGGFYRGAPPASEDDVISLEAQFSKCILPEDFIAFLYIHNGFWKSTDSTGILATQTMNTCFQDIQNLLKKSNKALRIKGKSLDPKSLIPFYESFGMPYFQCFCTEWYPENEMGNVYFSASTCEISDLDKGLESAETLAFPTFLDWLMFYLEKVE